jgi:hypothetical protein
MAGKYRVLDNQTMMDVVLQATGSHEAGMVMCRDNNVSITDVPEAGSVMVVSDAALALGDAGVLRRYAAEGVTVANADVQYAAGGLLTDAGDQLLTDDGAALLVD